MLRELQEQFMHGLFENQAVPGISPPAALATYANNARVNFTETLQRTYPAIWRLVGEDYFRQCAREYRRRYPSRSGDLQHVGRHFGEYLSSLHRADEFSYLADVARLEWAYQEALTERELPSLDVSRLTAVEADKYGDLRFRLQPSARLVESAFPILAIWRANTGEGDDASPELVIDLTRGADSLLVLQIAGEVRVYRLAIGEAALLQALKALDPFASAVEAAGELDPEFDPSASMQKWVALGAIVDFSL